AEEGARPAARAAARGQRDRRHRRRHAAGRGEGARLNGGAARSRASDAPTKPRPKDIALTDISTIQPDRTVAVREVFGIDTDLRVPAFAERDDHVPEIDEAYRFNRDV